jgi:hypothetical protein
MIPSNQRDFKFKGTRTKRAPVYYLRGGDETDAWREDLATALLAQRDSWLKRTNAGASATRKVGAFVPMLRNAQRWKRRPSTLSLPISAQTMNVSTSKRTIAGLRTPGIKGATDRPVAPD